MRKLFFILLLFISTFANSQKFLLGKYVSEEPSTSCFIELTLFEKNKKIWFRLKTNNRNIVGKAIISKDEGLYYVTLPIEWTEYEGDISRNSKTVDMSKSKPFGIQFMYDNKGLVSQNTGNAMNYYVKLGECDEKYIHLKNRNF